MVSSSDEDEDALALERVGSDEHGEMRHARDRLNAKTSSLSRSMGEATDEEVIALVRKISARAEASEAEEEDESAAADIDDIIAEDGLALAAAREKTLLSDRRNDAGRVSTSGGGRGDASGAEEARSAMRNFIEQMESEGHVGKIFGAAGVVNVANAKEMTDAIMDTVDVGRPICCAVGSGRCMAVGTDGGFIFLQRETKDSLHPTVSCLRTANNFAGLSVTPSVISLCFSERGDWLLAGYDDGGMALWDVKRNPTILKTIVGAHRTPVIALAILPGVGSSGIVDAISSEEGGLVIHHTFCPLGMGVIRVKSTSLGERTFVISAQAMPRTCQVSASDICGHENGIISSTWGESPCTFNAATHIADAAGIVALCTMNAVLIMRLHPHAEVIAKIVRPSDADKTVSPVMCWSPRNLDNIVVENDVEDCNLVVVWGTSVYVLAVKVDSAQSLNAPSAPQTKRGGNSSQILQSWSFDCSVSKGAISVAWLTKGVICVLSDRQKLYVYTPDGRSIETISLNEPPSSREITRKGPGQDGNAERLQCWHGTVVVHGVYIAILSPSRLRLSKFLGWRERVFTKKSVSDWVGAFDILLRVRASELPLWPVLHKKYIDAEETKRKALDVLVQLIPEFLSESLRLRGPQADDPLYQNAVTRVILGLLRAFDALQQVYSPAIFGAFLNSKCETAFLEHIVPHIMSDELRALPVEVMQALVDHYAALGDADVIEKCVLHMAVESLDLNQVARLCKQHGMYSAFAHVFTQALNDFTTPMETMFTASLGPVFGEKSRVRQLLLFMLESMRGRSFPTGQGELPNDLVARVHMEIMTFLLAPVALDSFANFSHDIGSRTSIAWAAAMKLAVDVCEQELPPPRLLYVLLAEPNASSSVLKEVIRDWDATESEILNVTMKDDERMGSQIIVEAAVFAAKACGQANLTASRSSLLTFTASIVGAGRAAVTQEVEQDLLEALATAKTANDEIAREDAMVSIIARRIDEDITLRNEAFVLELSQSAGFVQAEAVIHIASGNYMRALRALTADKHRPNAAAHYVDVLLGKASPGVLLLQQNQAGFAAARAHPLVAERVESFRKDLLASMPALVHISAEVCARIAVVHFPHSQAEVLSALSSEPVLQFQYLRQVLEAVHQSSESDRHPHDMTLVDLVSASQTFVTPDMNELYFRLMCQFEPQGVLAFLRSDNSEGLDDEMCLSYCRRFQIMDAVAHLLERSERFEEALSIYLQHYSTSIRAMAHLFDPIGAQWTKAASKESLMKGFTIEANAALNVAITLCRRVASRAERGDELWWSCLDSIIRSLLELDGKSYAAVRNVLQEHLDYALQIMLGRVDNAQILEMLVIRHGSRDISELRKLFTRVFGNCALEREFLKAEGSSIAEEAGKKEAEDFRQTRRGRRGSQRVLR